MPRSAKVTYGMIGLCALLLTGCGEKLKSLTTEEEDIIAMYAAKVVEKHNVHLGQGVIRYRGNLDDEEDTQEEESEDVEAEEEEPLEDEAQTGQSTSGETASLEEEPQDTVQEATLTDVLGFDGVDFVFEGVSIPESLRLSDYYTLPDPQPGNQYVIAAFDATNRLQNAQTVSMMELSPRFTATLNGETSNAGMVLDQDLMTYEGTIDPGASERLILLFEFSENAAANLSDFGLTVDVNGTKSRLIL
ncbi:MAG: hypothetical protein IJ679_13290 [Lachnospiraceae bacterium]|nr:hypothetical protein [Lachnospiraceae bacterium]